MSRHGGAAPLAACFGAVLRIDWHAGMTAATRSCMQQACLPDQPACGRARAQRDALAGPGRRARGAHRVGELLVQVVLRPDQHLEQARQPRLLLLCAAPPRWAVRRGRATRLKPYPTPIPPTAERGCACPGAEAAHARPVGAGRGRLHGGARPRRTPRRRSPTPVPAAARKGLTLGPSDRGSQVSILDPKQHLQAWPGGAHARAAARRAWHWLSRMAALSSLAVFCRCATSIRSATGQLRASSNASSATVRSARRTMDLTALLLPRRKASSGIDARLRQRICGAYLWQRVRPQTSARRRSDVALYRSAPGRGAGACSQDSVARSPKARIQLAHGRARCARPAPPGGAGGRGRLGARAAHPARPAARGAPRRAAPGTPAQTPAPPPCAPRAPARSGAAAAGGTPAGASPPGSARARAAAPLSRAPPRRARPPRPPRPAGADSRRDPCLEGCHSLARVWPAWACKQGARGGQAAEAPRPVQIGHAVADRPQRGG